MSLLGGSSQSFFILNITDRNPEIWQDPNQGSMGLLNERLLAPLRPTYLWDLHTLSESFGNPNIDGFMTVDPFDQAWAVIWLEQFANDIGSDVYEPLPTAFTVSPFNRPISKNFTSSGSFTLAALITENITDGSGNQLIKETLLGEYTVYKLALFPAMPFLIGSSVPSFKHFGPVFAKDMSFSVSGDGAISPVHISVNFTGGKCVFSPPMVQLAPLTIPTDGTDPTASQEYIPYRQANLGDCLVGFDVWSDLATMQSELAYDLLGEIPDPYNPFNTSLDPSARIVELELSIHQDVNFQVTQPDNTNLGFSMEQGPRWAAIENRRVTGAITLYTRLDVIDQPNTGSLTMYFGGPFFFPMDNVDWQRPKQKIQAGKGWLHTFEFIARAADITLTRGFDSYDDGATAVSEFAISTLGFGTSTSTGGGLTF